DTMTSVYYTLSLHDALPILRRLRRLLVQRVIHGAQLRIDGGNLQHFARLAIANVHIVVEVQRARRPRRNLVALQTRLGKHEHLRSEEHTSELQSRENLVCRL